MDHLKALSGDRATVLDMNSQNTQAVLASADVLITDYSSASFDCAYIGVPVLYFQFDQEHFYHNRGGYYVEPRRELPGRVITTQEQLMAELQSVAERNWQPEPQFSARLKDFFDHRDDRNCARLFDVIQERLVMVTNCTAGGKTSGPQCC
jgi:CDP-glycerol glycerophosphotransferase (TagB/SpsB family)